MRTRKPLFAAVALSIFFVGPANGQICVGDCDANTSVSVSEVVRCINIALGNQPALDCLSCDTSGDGEVTVGDAVEPGSNSASALL